MMNITRTPFPYRHGDADLYGILVRNESLSLPRPGILLIHEFTGLTAPMLAHAERLAAEGYIVLAADMYGRGILPADASEASRISRIYRDDRKFMRERAAAGLRALAAVEGVDGSAIAVLGFSFGGCVALELARSGAELAAACSVYGYLNTPFPAAPGDVRCPVLALHGALDKVVPMAEVAPFVEEMRDADVQCRMVIYTDAGHGFCNPTVQTDARSGSFYDPKIAERAWKDVLDFLRVALLSSHA
ncbi:dienelactone hydrolase family protein [Desulfocurvibacter africanus]|uniref:Dienelactone hydrolase n=1 Tax=Desulfocurvibacter africanus subsp. africanus str. Walvis Bay TaxID=690850 RepID=F3YW69_DESAF|nr:dienelactone hydrolase family protein [Desulfocurvibacter africanus]EGJ49172.1 dienelactone hydrolase [Desulfocurvibacter africanus subsp. africanus str. Walvis Bay]